MKVEVLKKEDLTEEALRVPGQLASEGEEEALQVPYASLPVKEALAIVEEAARETDEQRSHRILLEATKSALYADSDVLFEIQEIRRDLAKLLATDELKREVLAKLNRALP